jgi:aspartate kinase
MIVQNIATAGRTEVSFTVSSADLRETLAIAREVAGAIGAERVTHDAEVAKVSAVGLGMRTHTGVARTMFEAIAGLDINIQMITTSEIKISVLIDRASAARALRAVHEAFGLAEALELDVMGFDPAASRRGLGRATAIAGGAVVAGMEDLVVSGVELDEAQAQVTLLNVADKPGTAASVFRAVSDAGVFVDMIVQNVGTDGNTHLSLTVPHAQANLAAESVRGVVGADRVVIRPKIAKLSVLGVGVRTHTGAATRMFGALAEAGINIALINTSEVRINVAVDHERARAGLRGVCAAFGLLGGETSGGVAARAELV